MKLGQGCHKGAPRWHAVVMIPLTWASLPGAVASDGKAESWQASPAPNRPMDQNPPIANLKRHEKESNDARAATEPRYRRSSSAPKTFSLLLRIPQVRPKATAQTPSQLRERVLVNFQDVPILDALRHLSGQVGLKVKIEKDSVAEECVETGTPVSLKLSVPISLQAALNLILEPRKLRHEIEGEYIIVKGQPKP